MRRAMIALLVVAGCTALSEWEARDAYVDAVCAATPRHVGCASAQPLTSLGFTLDGQPGPGWVETPLGVVSEIQLLSWRLTLRGAVPVAEVLRDRLA